MRCVREVSVNTGREIGSWRLRHGLSPVAATTCAQGHPLPVNKPSTHGASGCQLYLVAPARTPAQPPGTDVLCDSDDAQRPIEKHDVDRKRHTDRVDTAQRVRQQKSALLINGVATEQSAGTTEAAGRHDLHPGNQRCMGQRIAKFEHAAIVLRREHSGCAPDSRNATGSARTAQCLRANAFHRSPSATLRACSVRTFTPATM
jgi:hypothetical protein